MTLVMLLLKSALLVVVVAVYWRPLDIAKAVGVPPPEGGFVEMQGHVARFMLTFMSFTWALSCSSTWHYTLMVLIALQTICWASFMSKNRVLSGVFENFVDAQSEKEAFQLAAVVLFGLVLAIVLFGGRAVGKYYYRRRLRAFYAKHNPKKIGEITKILKKYKGKEELLFTRLSRKYSVLSHTATEDAVDELDHDDAFVPEREVIEEVEYIQEPLTKTMVVAETVADGENSEEDDEGFQVIKSTIKSPIHKPQSGPASPATKSPVEKAPAPPRSPVTSPNSSNDISTNPATSAAVRTAIEDARRAQEERVQQRVAELSARGKKKQ